ncbi:hypothetical protein CLV24_11088 [Pontibacter ummariensis]|uniref:Uncharacterized protein n=1 Tax=Pontibacter ummariensis TaxID=1610492 RepID=A0A239G5H7_9BACT|nr:hypothetical protein CLV24_11088 [Pontibacter ummariensis]SNS64028.1 hypothetical protein SAMN06296052_11060 [Pontibacter ummariensis]
MTPVIQPLQHWLQGLLFLAVPAKLANNGHNSRCSLTIRTVDAISLNKISAATYQGRAQSRSTVRVSYPY